MTKKMLIDAGHPEETRVVVLDGSKVEDFDFEAAARKPIRGNIYLAKVTRVEPSLQAAFVEYGGNRHGFLAFNEIHPDYYQIPFEDRQALKDEEAAQAAEDEDDEESEDEEGGDSGGEDAPRVRRASHRRYKIQEVIKRRQILLVQVAKEERGNKGAALTTYLSLAGRYCVLMPNTPRGGGISRKIASAKDRKRLKDIVADFETPKGMGLIIRTAGLSRTKAEIRRDYEYLMRLWENIRETTLKSVAPALTYEEGDLVKRVIRDLYDKDVEAILVEGEAAYKEAKSFIRMLMPSHASKVQHYRDNAPLYLRYKVEEQLESVYSPTVPLKSGGYIVINPTEALVSIDVNSGRATRERNIETTALKTNLEAADEAARQMRLRDLAGLIVIDFIDMEDSKNVRAVEKRMKDAVGKDRARLQLGKISQFGLMEISRQRRRTSIIEGSTTSCPHCKGTGYLRSVESSALVALRALEEEGQLGRAGRLRLSTPTEVAIYLLNEKRDHLLAIEQRYGFRVLVSADPALTPPEFGIEVLEGPGDRVPVPVAPPIQEPEEVDQNLEDDADDEEAAVSNDSDESESSEEKRDRPSAEAAEGGGRRRRRRRRRGGASDAPPDSTRSAEETESAGDEAVEAGEEAEGAETRTPRAPAPAGDDEDGRPRKRRRRGRRGGRGRRRDGDESSPQNGAARDSEETQDALTVIEPEGATAEPDVVEALPQAEAPPKRKRPGRRGKAAEAEAETAAAVEPAPEPAPEAPVAKPKRAPRKKAPAPKAAEPEASPEPVKEKTPPAKPARSRSRKKAAGTAPATEETAPAEAAATEADEAPPAKAADAKPKRKGWWQRPGGMFGG